MNFYCSPIVKNKIKGYQLHLYNVRLEISLEKEEWFRAVPSLRITISLFLLLTLSICTLYFLFFYSTSLFLVMSTYFFHLKYEKYSYEIHTKIQRIVLITLLQNMYIIILFCKNCIKLSQLHLHTGCIFYKILNRVTVERSYRVVSILLYIHFYELFQKFINFLFTTHILRNIFLYFFFISLIT